MKKNIFAIVIIIVLLVTAAVLILGHKSTTYKKGVNDFAVEDTATVTKIFLADKKNNTILLSRQENGTWTLNDKYLARKSGIDLLLETMKNLLPKYPVPLKAHNNIVAQMATRSVKVEIYQIVYRINLGDNMQWFPHEKLTKTYYVGDPTADNMGTFMLMEGADEPFVVHLLGLRGYVGPRYSTQERDWRDHTVFKIKLADIQKVKMEIPADPQNSFEVINKDEGMVLIRSIDQQVMPGYDTLKMLNFLTAFNDLRYESLMEGLTDPARQDSIVHSTPMNIVTVVDKNGKSVSIKTFYKPNDPGTFDEVGKLYPYDVDRMYALINDDRDFVLLQYFVFDKVLRKLSFFAPGK